VRRKRGNLRRLRPLCEGRLSSYASEENQPPGHLRKKTGSRAGLRANPFLASNGLQSRHRHASMAAIGTLESGLRLAGLGRFFRRRRRSDGMTRARSRRGSHCATSRRRGNDRRRRTWSSARRCGVGRGRPTAGRRRSTTRRSRSRGTATTAGSRSAAATAGSRSATATAGSGSFAAAAVMMEKG